MATRVVHVRDRVPGAVYIGRRNLRAGLKGSYWANPFKIGPDGTREEVIAKYKAWLLSDDPNAVALRERLPELRGKVLCCWCHPLTCHGDVLAALADALPD